MAPNKIDENDTKTIPPSHRADQQVYRVTYVKHEPPPIIEKQPREWWRGINPRRQRRR